jgi:glycosyltransferase involved in cell wall biosynthesis
VRVLFLPDYAGSNPYQRQLARALRARGVKVSMAGAPRRNLAPILWGWLRRGCPRVVHLHWTHQYLGGADITPGPLVRARFIGQLRLLRLLGVRLVWTVHNLGSHEGARDPVEMAVHRRLVELCGAVICHCQAAVAAAVEAYQLTPELRQRLHVVPHGSYLGVYPNSTTRAQARDRLGIPHDARLLLFIGAVRPYKGLEDLLAAFRRLEHLGLRLIVAGRPRRPEAAAPLAAAAAADPRVSLRLDFVPGNQLQVLLNASDAVVLPFRDILTSGSMILAMSFGKAIVAPSMGCLPNTLPEGGGILYDPDDPEALERALRSALDSDLEAMGARNLERARQLDWGSIAAATEALYRKS